MNDIDVENNKIIIKKLMKELCIRIDKKSILGSLQIKYLKRIERKALKIASFTVMKKVKKLSKKSKRKLSPLYLRLFIDEITSKNDISLFSV